MRVMWVEALQEGASQVNFTDVVSWQFVPQSNSSLDFHAGCVVYEGSCVGFAPCMHVRAIKYPDCCMSNMCTHFRGLNWKTLSCNPLEGSLKGLWTTLHRLITFCQEFFSQILLVSFITQDIDNISTICFFQYLIFCFLSSKSNRTPLQFHRNLYPLAKSALLIRLSLLLLLQHKCFPFLLWIHSKLCPVVIFSQEKHRPGGVVLL